MRKIISFMHISVDGYATDPKGSMDWVHVDDDIFDYAGDQTENADTAIYGRVTWEMMDAYWPTAGNEPGASKHDVKHSNWYNQVEKIVLSRTVNDPQKTKTKFIGSNVPDEIRRLKQLPGKNIIMFGSPGAVKSLLKEDLVDEFWLFINPIILGGGNPYWENMNNKVKLTLASNDSFTSGVVCLHYVRP